MQIKQRFCSSKKAKLKTIKAHFVRSNVTPKHISAHTIKSPVHSRGFTLIELLVSMVITAIIGGMAVAGLGTAVRSVESVEKNAERLARLNNFFLRFERDIQHIVPRSVVLSLNPQPAFSFTGGSTENSITFSNTGRINPAPEVFKRSEIQQISYVYQDNTMIRKRWSETQRESAEKNKEQVLLENVNSVSYKFIAPQPPQAVGASTNQFQSSEIRWLTAWPDPSVQGQNQALNANGIQQADTSLPVAIEISIDVEPWGVITRIFEVVDG